MRKITVIAITIVCLHSRSRGVNVGDGDFSLDLAYSYQQGLEKSINNIESKIMMLDNLFPESDKDHRTYQDTRAEITNIVMSMKKTKQALTSDLLLIGKYKREMNKNNIALRATSKSKKQGKNAIERLTKLLYKLHNELYDQGNIDDIKLFTKMTNITDGANQEVYMEILLKKLDELITTLEIDEKKHKEIIKIIYEKKHEIQRRIGLYQKHVQNIERKIAYLDSYIDTLQNNKEALNKKIDEITNTRTEIEDTILQITKNIQSGEYAPQRDREYSKQTLQNLTNYGAEDIYTLSRPVLPIKHIKYYFNDPTYEQEYNIKHHGIRITIPQGKAVHAAKDGIVVKVIKNDIGISWITLAHTNGYTTSYLYLNDIYVTEGSIVRKGTVIGRTGGEAGTQGAGLFTQGSNITLLVTKGPRFINPLAILDLSAIDNENMIPDELTFKYKRDIERRPIDLTKLTTMEGESERERQKTFLETYAKGVFQSISLREQAGKSHAIDPSFVMCIGFAESTLGHHLTTANNMGNVGNPDNPGVRTNIDAGPLAGIEVIYDTLDNKYLGHYNRIDELSRYRREEKTSAIYASSTFNRQNNVLKCLTMIKGYHVPEDYAFRTGPRTAITNSFSTTSTSQRGR